ncbi:MAG: hypothetical protein ACPGLY_27955 [Rubripirellula sp.]
MIGRFDASRSCCDVTLTPIDPLVMRAESATPWQYRHTATDEAAIGSLHPRVGRFSYLDQFAILQEEAEFNWTLFTFWGNPTTPFSVARLRIAVVGDTQSFPSSSDVAQDGMITVDASLVTPDTPSLPQVSPSLDTPQARYAANGFADYDFTYSGEDANQIYEIDVTAHMAALLAGMPNPAVGTAFMDLFMREQPINRDGTNYCLTSPKPELIFYS